MKHTFFSLKENVHKGILEQCSVRPVETEVHGRPQPYQSTLQVEIPWFQGGCAEQEQIASGACGVES